MSSLVLDSNKVVQHITDAMPEWEGDCLKIEGVVYVPYRKGEITIVGCSDPIPEDYVPGKYKWIDADFVPNPGFVPPTPPPLLPGEVFLHVELTGGDGMTPLGIANDGLEAILVTATLRAGLEPDSMVLPISFERRVTVRTVEDNQIYDIVKVAFVNGVATINYTTTEKPNICHLIEADMDPVDANGRTYYIKLVGDTAFKVYRSLTPVVVS